MDQETAAPEPVVGHLWLADWRRRVGELYADVRAFATEDPQLAWHHWIDVREALFREHPMSPLPLDRRRDFRARHFAYDPALRLEAPMEPPGVAADPDLGDPVLLPSSGPASPAVQVVGRLRLDLPEGSRGLTLFRLEDYAGGLLLVFGDTTNGSETYGAGRYVLDTAKGADLGGDPLTATLVVDLNFAYHPSCAWDPRWSCPLAPPENRLDVPIRAGERLV